MSKVKCLVEECKFNNNCCCDANAIEVRSSHCSAVSCADETACETFQHR